MHFIRDLQLWFSFVFSLAIAQAPQKSGNRVRFGAGNYPRTTRLADVSLLRIYGYTAKGSRSIITIKSTNNGGPWEDLGRVFVGPSDAKDLGNLFVHKLANSRVLAAFRSHDRSIGDHPWSYYRIIVFESTESDRKLAIFEVGMGNSRFKLATVCTKDDGATWSLLSRSDIYEAPGKAAGEPQIIRIGNALVADFGTNEDGGEWPRGTIKLLVSRDGANTWGDKATVNGTSSAWAEMVGLDNSSFLVLYDAGDGHIRILFKNSYFTIL
ncbi:hypothetical protein CC78DRAFT_590762 [Lojkania enalia]|uniref:Glycoside hydrolase family 93 protein n=1 Tax=Lojkania enalia TaxID=147567 RepID=A0A9P4JZY1_9PLEO|nr:hypothetical protein CC78DRAFT_590762 [Didymosphaeria enalia]